MNITYVKMYNGLLNSIQWYRLIQLYERERRREREREKERGREGEEREKEGEGKLIMVAKRHTEFHKRNILIVPNL